MLNIDNYLDNHYIHRSNWLRAAVLGANDGILSITSIAIGIAAASNSREPIVLTSVRLKKCYLIGVFDIKSYSWFLWKKTICN